MDLEVKVTYFVIVRKCICLKIYWYDHHSVTFGKSDKRPIDQRRPVNMKITVNFVTVIFYGKVESYSLSVFTLRQPHLSLLEP